jgi:hypothetical protein
MYRYLNKDEYVAGLKCQKHVVGEYDTLVDYPGDLGKRYYINQGLWVDYILTEEDAKGLNEYTGDPRTSPGIPDFLFRLFEN